MSNNYRLDYRNKEQFKKDIKEGTKLELYLFHKWIKTFTNPPTFKENGCDNSGEYLEIDQVTTNTDFVVEGIGNLEVKFSRPRIKDNGYFHLKISQINSYIKQDATILMVNGTEEINPEFTLIGTNILKTFDKKYKKVYCRSFGGKLSYRIPISDFKWTPL